MGSMASFKSGKMPKSEKMSFFSLLDSNSLSWPSKMILADGLSAATATIPVDFLSDAGTVLICEKPSN